MTSDESRMFTEVRVERWRARAGIVIDAIAAMLIYPLPGSLTLSDKSRAWLAGIQGLECGSR